MATAEVNPLTEGLDRTPVASTTLVIFGVTGDLAQRKLLPALYNLAHEGALPDRFALIGFARGSDEHEFRSLLRESVEKYSRTPPEEDLLTQLTEGARYVSGPFEDAAAYRELARVLGEVDHDSDVPVNRLFYLSTAPQFFPVIASALGEAGLNRTADAEVRVIVEKPFGTNLASARALNEDLRSAFEERQIFRIDHYLGKETVQNMLALRFANGLFEPVWNRNFVDSVQLTAAEEVGIGSRAGYYETSGALRDLVQNHMLQLVALLCMEPPASFSADAVRDEKVKVLRAIEAPSLARVPEVAVRAQYGRGVSGGEPVHGYLDEDGVAEGSTTETYVALRLELSSWRWAGVPIYLRTGKRLKRKLTEIAVTLKPIPNMTIPGDAEVEPNQLVLTVQPDEGVSLTLGAKVPGAGMRIRPVNMEFRYGTSFLSESPEAYERLILDALRGDATLFTRDDEVEASWEVCEPILESWAAADGPLPTYEAGGDGPREADALLDSRRWRTL